MEVASTEDKFRGRLRWFAHLQYRLGDAVMQKNDLIHVEGKRSRGRSKII